MTRSRILVGALVAVGLVGSLAGVDAHLDDRRALSEARAAVVAAEAGVSAVESRQVAVRAVLAERLTQLDGTSSSLTDAIGRRDGAAAGLVALTGQRDEVAAGLQAVTDDLAGTQEALGAFRRAVDEQGSDIAALGTCLDGISRATGALDAADAAGAVAAMADVAGPCDAAEKALVGPAGTAAAMPFDFGDPFILHTSGSYYGYATNAAGGHIQLARSSDLEHWDWLGNALPSLPAWADAGRTWAPSVLQRGGTFVLYYAVADRASGRQCISTATSASPAGPFVDSSTQPFVCQLDQGGSIDPSPLVDAEGRPWLIWKGEGETAGDSAVMWSQPMADDGRSLVGVPTSLLRADRSWERNTIEGPSMVAGPGGYHLFYSAASWNSRGYAIGHALCSTPAGPCTKQGDGPVFGSSGSVAGPGGQELFVDRAGALRMSFHAWTDPFIGYPNKRNLHVATVGFDGTRPVISR